MAAALLHRQQLPLLNPLRAIASQPPFYMVIHINAVPFTVTANDKVRLPFLMKDAAVGATLRLTHVSTIGTRNYTLKGNPFIDEAAFTVRARVMEHTKEPFREWFKGQQRQRHKKRVTSKHPYTVLRICQLDVNKDYECSSSRLE